MNTIAPEIIKKFQPVFSVDEYQRLLNKYYYTVKMYSMYQGGQSKEEYWSKLPEFVLAKCPICGAEHTDWIDLHSTALVEYSKVDVARVYFYRRPPYGGCEHIVRMAAFMNLNGNEPQKRLYIESEVPYVTDILFPDSIKESYAVINAFPVCRIEDDEFVPTYTLYVLTYYGREPWKLQELKMPEWTGLFRPVLYDVDEAWENRDKRIFDLKYWVERGRLFWLDEEDGKAVLRNDPEAFPYVGIEGYVENLLFENGEMQVVGHDNPPRYYPTWKPEDWSKKQWKAFYKSKKEKLQPNWGCLLGGLSPIVLFMLVVVTSLFFRPLMDPVLAWMALLGGTGWGVYVIVKDAVSEHKRRRRNLSESLCNATFVVVGFLLSVSVVVLASGWALRLVGTFVLRQTGLEWAGIVSGMLAAFVAGFGAGRVMLEGIGRLAIKLKRYLSV